MGRPVRRQARRDLPHISPTPRLYLAHITPISRPYLAGKDVEICEKIEEEKNMNLHCYICKMWGHTKVNCPSKRCRFCGKQGHVQENCPAKDEQVAGKPNPSP